MDVKLDAIRCCFEQGENIKYLSEDIGYSRTSIYQWRKRYLKESTLGLMNNKNILSGELKEGTSSAESIDLSSHEVTELKMQMLQMQME
ncbi:MAG: helix-turn-helix domain-containing protein [Roseburia sp.]